MLRLLALLTMIVFQACFSRSEFLTVSRDSEDSFDREAFDPIFVTSDEFSLLQRDINTTFKLKFEESGKCLAVAAKENGVLPELQFCNDSSNQRFEYARTEAGQRFLRSLYSGKCLDVMGGSQQEGGKVHQWDCLPDVTSQKILLTGLGDDDYAVTFLHSGKHLKVQDGKTVQTGLVHNLMSHRFKPIAIHIPQFVDMGASFRLRNENSKLCLTVGGKASGEQLFQQQCSDSSKKQRFRKVLLGNNRLSLRSLFSNKCIAVDSRENESHIVQNDCDYSLAQILHVQKVAASESAGEGSSPSPSEKKKSYDNLVTLTNTFSGKCIGIRGDSKDDKGRANQWTCDRNKSRQFHFEATINEYPSPADQVTRIIWSFWDTGEANMPLLYRLNLENWKKLNPDWQVRIINDVPGDKDYIFNILDEYDADKGDYLVHNWNHLEDVAAKFKNARREDVRTDPRIVKSDLIRLAILELAGGVYSDLSNIMLKPLEDFFVRDFNRSASSLAGYSFSSAYASDQSPRSNGVAIDGFENWFIAAKRGSPFVREWRKAFDRYWETRTVAQPTLSHPMFTDGLFDRGRLGYDHASYLNQHAAFKYTIQNHPYLAATVYMVDWNPWKVHGRFGFSADAVYRSMTEEADTYAAKLLGEWTPLLKFASVNLRVFNHHFRTLEDFCRKPNIVKHLYQLSCPDLESSPPTNP